MLIRTKITGIGDPFILKAGNVYYAYATSAPEKGFRYFTSCNLIDWQDGGFCYQNSSWGEECFWAPEVYERGGRYYMLYTARWKKNHSLRIGLAVADFPEGPFYDVKEGPMFDFGYACIDATLFTDDDGKNYLYYVRDCAENIIDGVHTSEIYCVELTDDLRKAKGTPRRIVTPDDAWETSLNPAWRWNEGPALLKHGGKYYLNYSVNCFDSPEYSIGCAVADAPEGPFVKYGYPVLKKAEGDFSGPGHNSFFRDADGNLYTAFHIHTDKNKPSGDRRMCIGKAGFSSDGVFFIDVKEGAEKNK